MPAGPRVPESWRSRAARWIANCAPAYRGCGARVTAIRDDFREVHVRLPLSWRTRNHVGLIWGGSLYAAIDPVLGVMLRVLLGPGHYVVDRAATIAFLRPARGEDLAARGTPKGMEELEGHDTAWPDGGKRASFRGKGPPPPASVACDDFTVILEVAKAGGGIAVLPIHLAKPLVREGALVRLFPDVVLRNAPLFLVTRRERPLPARVEVFRAHLIESVPSLLV